MWKKIIEPFFVSTLRRTLAFSAEEPLMAGAIFFQVPYAYPAHG